MNAIASHVHWFPLARCYAMSATARFTHFTPLSEMQAANSSCQATGARLCSVLVGAMASMTDQDDQQRRWEPLRLSDLDTMVRVVHSGVTRTMPMAASYLEATHAAAEALCPRTLLPWARSRTNASNITNVVCSLPPESEPNATGIRASATGEMFTLDRMPGCTRIGLLSATGTVEAHATVATFRQRRVFLLRVTRRPIAEGSVHSTPSVTLERVAPTSLAVTPALPSGMPRHSPFAETAQPKSGQPAVGTEARWASQFASWGVRRSDVINAGVIATAVAKSTLPVLLDLWATEPALENGAAERAVAKVLRVLARLHFAPQSSRSETSLSFVSETTIRAFAPTAARTFVKSTNQTSLDKHPKTVSALWEAKRAGRITVRYGCAACGCDHQIGYPCPLRDWRGDWTTHAPLRHASLSQLKPITLTVRARANDLTDDQEAADPVGNESEVIVDDATGAITFEAPIARPPKAGKVQVAEAADRETLAAIRVAQRDRGETVGDAYKALVAAVKRQRPEASAWDTASLDRLLLERKVYDADSFITALNQSLHASALPAAHREELFRLTVALGSDGSNSVVFQRLRGIRSRRRERLDLGAYLQAGPAVQPLTPVRETHPKRARRLERATARSQRAERQKESAETETPRRAPSQPAAGDHMDLIFVNTVRIPPSGV
jgi:hypothetical protein